MKKLTSIFILAGIFIGLSGCSQIQTLKRSCYQSSQYLATEVGYCSAVRVGNSVHISGSVGRGDMDKAIEEAYSGIRQTLALHGLTMDNVVSEHVQTSNIQLFLKNKHIRRSYYSEILPASSWVQVDGFYAEDIVIQVDVKAIYPRKFKIINFDSW